MLLTVDIGNSNISFGLFKSKRLIKSFDIATKAYSKKLLRLKLKNQGIKDSIICSVVPKKTKVLVKDIEQLFSVRPYIIGKDIKVPIKNYYRNPDQLGQDRLINAYAGAKIFGSPLIVVDFGTAVTFDVISGKNEYLGGMIFPGMKVSLAALHSNTAVLPKLNLTQPSEFIGKDTKSSILSGIVYGYAFLTEGLSGKIREKIGKKAKVIATGGDAFLMAKYSKAISTVDNDLTLKGLCKIYLSNKSQKKS